MGSLRRLARDPFLLTLAGITVAAWAWFALAGGDRARSVPAYWAAQVPLDAALGIGAYRLRQLAAAQYRRFWGLIAVAGLSFTVGDGTQTVLTLLDPAGRTMSGGTAQTVFFTIGMSCNVLACLMFPQGLRTGREKLIFWLDATTVLVGGAVMAWCFAVYPVDEHIDRVNASLTAALVIVAAFSATKVALIPRPPMTRMAAWPMVAAPMVQGLSTFLPGVFQEQNHAFVYAIRLLPSLLIAVGPRIQEIVARVDGHQVRAKRRPYSLLPYGMIVLTFLIFFAMLPDRVSPQLWGAIAGVAVITALVAGRQLVSFQDNTKLIGRLDVALAEVRDQEALLREQAAFDQLTGLTNRAYFNDRLAATLAAGDGHTVLLIDLDDFKTINDTMGHAAGDALLTAVSGRFRAAVRDSDVVARLGGDEFAVLLRDTIGADDGARVAEDILRRLAEPVRIGDHTIATRASIGVAHCSPGDEPSVVLSNADIAMYEAKRRGKSTWVRYDDAMGARIGAEAELVRDLAHAAEAGQFTLLYQPIVELATGRLTGVESLIRWHHPARGLIAPADFIPAAERSGLIVEIGRWALREACRQGAAWRSRHPGAHAMTVGVNVAGRQLRTAGFVDEVARVLAETGLPAQCLTVEVTETAVLDDEESVEAMLGLRRLGVRLALDDFGTAASSLGLLLTCPVTTLKLDRSFVESVTTVRRQAAVATAVSQMADALGLSSVAEGIETEEQRELLLGLGYHYGQGYLFARPSPASHIDDMWAVLAVGRSRSDA